MWTTLPRQGEVINSLLGGYLTYLYLVYRYTLYQVCVRKLGNPLSMDELRFFSISKAGK